MHTFANHSDAPARYLLVITPASFERYFARMGRRRAGVGAAAVPGDDRGRAADTVRGMKRAIFIAPFDELSEPARVAELAERAERRGWDGFFLWDHIDYRPPVRRWPTRGSRWRRSSMRTERLITGPLVTPLARRRPHQLARETVTLDRLSGGRLVLGVGAGSDRSGEFDRERFGEEPDMKARAKLLDDGIAKLQDYWARRVRAAPRERDDPDLGRRPLAVQARPARARRGATTACSRSTRRPRRRWPS